MRAGKDGEAPKVVSKQIVVPSGMPAEGRDALGRELFAIHRKVFAGVDKSAFDHHVISPQARSTQIQLYRDQNGGLIGYCAVHVFHRMLKGREVIVLRAEAGLLPEYRGRGTVYWFGMVCALRQKLRHPLTRVFYLGTLVHMSSYHLFYKYFPRFFPQPASRASDPLRGDALGLIETFSDPPADASDPLIRDVGWITIETPQERSLPVDSADISFFRSRNPGYPKGLGLVVIVPITFPNIFAAIANRLIELCALALRRQPPQL